MPSSTKASVFLALSLLPLGTLACGDKDGADCALEIVNSTGYDMYYVYVADSADTDWGADVLGDDVLLDGESVLVDVASNPDSYYDIKAIDNEGDEYYAYEFDFCSDGEALSYTLTMNDFAG